MKKCQKELASEVRGLRVLIYGTIAFALLGFIISMSFTLMCFKNALELMP